MTIYEKIIQDIKSNEAFLVHQNSYNTSCKLFKVSEFAHNICQFDINSLRFLKPKSIDLIKHFDEIECSKKNLSDDVNKGLTIDMGLNRFSDKGNLCFKLWFSEIVRSKVIVEITPMNYEFSPPETLNFIYKIDDKSSIELIETFGAMIN